MCIAFKTAMWEHKPACLVCYGTLGTRTRWVGPKPGKSKAWITSSATSRSCADSGQLPHHDEPEGWRRSERTTAHQNQLRFNYDHARPYTTAVSSRTDIGAGSMLRLLPPSRRPLNHARIIPPLVLRQRYACSVSIWML